MAQVLVICGPTATGKTAFGIEMAKLLNGEIVSADSRQVYVGRDLITGKDVSSSPQKSHLAWRDRTLKYYLEDGIKIWLYDVVESGEEFNVSFWKECADIMIADIISRDKPPVVVGGTGLYIKSLTNPLTNISIKSDPKLRKKLESMSASDLFDYLKSLDHTKAESLNDSDAKNPRRLIRAIEILLQKKDFPSPESGEGTGGEVLNKNNFLHICLSSSTSYLFPRIDKRVEDRIAKGAAIEDPVLAADPQKWKYREHDLARRQITWFKKQPNLHWYDISTPDWKKNAMSQINTWYNNHV